MPESKEIEINIDGLRVPLKLIREWRTSIRSSIGKEKVILRVPVLLSKSSLNQQIKLTEKWVKKQFLKHPGLRKRFEYKEYDSGYKICLQHKIYILDIEETKALISSGKQDGDILKIWICNNLTKRERSKAIPKILSKLIANDNIALVRERVILLNNKFFKKEIRNIRLKNNYTNWGSCSSNGNINISTRILFAPQEVQDYVLIHELAHLIEMNHTKRFWDIVRSIDSDYKSKIHWLRNNSNLCYF